MKNILCILFIYIFVSNCIHSQQNGDITELKLIISKKTDFCRDIDCGLPPLSMMGHHINIRYLDDTLFYIHISANMEKLYVYNQISHEIRSIPLDSVNGLGIRQLYYHNHDSIFFLYEEPHVYKMKQYLEKNIADFLLINGRTEELWDTYQLDSVPFHFNGDISQWICLDGATIEMNRIKDGNLLIAYNIYFPYPSQNYNPRLVCSYNLADHTLKMLNIKTPSHFIGRKYGDYNSPVINWAIDGNLLVSFGGDASLFKYDFASDSMYSVYQDTNRILLNIDSAQMKKNKDYMNIYFWDIMYCSTLNLYCRTATIKTGKNNDLYFTEFWDTNFNHLGYCFENADYEHPFCSEDGVLRVKNKKTDEYFEVANIQPVKKNFKEVKKQYFVHRKGKKTIEEF
ncbi:MAG: hypothetical protein LBR36_04185 [Bacteroidales bacterium]|jgi:hypothetical protein|nr:hypothetical protein [Bacteroidales bacterium]